MTEPRLPTHAPWRTVNRPFLIPAVLVLSGFLAAWAEGMGAAVAALMGAVVGIGCLPLALYVRNRLLGCPARPFPLIVLTGGFYAVFFGLSALLSPFIYDPAMGRLKIYGGAFIDPVGVDVLAVVLAGLVVLLMGYALGIRFVFRHLPDLSFDPQSQVAGHVRLLLWGLLFGHVMYFTLPFVRTLPSVAQFLVPSGFVAFGGFFVLTLKGRLPRWEGVAAFGVALPVVVYSHMSTTFLTQLILLVVEGGALALWCGRSRVLWLAPVAVGLFLVGYPLSHVYRAHIYEHPGLGTWERVHVLPEVWNLIQGENGLDWAYLSRRAGVISRKVGFVFPLARVVRSTPDTVPYWGGETYRGLMTTLVPRVLMPDKPRETWGNAFGRRYALIAESNTTMSVNIPWLTELYANFGVAGVVGGMGVIGLLLAALSQLLNRPARTPLGAGVAAGVLVPMFYQESNFSVMMGSVPLLIACLWVYFRLGGWILARLFQSERI